MNDSSHSLGSEQLHENHLDNMTSNDLPSGTVFAFQPPPLDSEQAEVHERNQFDDYEDLTLQNEDFSSTSLQSSLTNRFTRVAMQDSHLLPYRTAGPGKSYELNTIPSYLVSEEDSTMSDDHRSLLERHVISPEKISKPFSTPGPLAHSTTSSSFIQLSTTSPYQTMSEHTNTLSRALTPEYIFYPSYDSQPAIDVETDIFDGSSISEDALTCDHQ